jgi:hypothetical protein
VVNVDWYLKADRVRKVITMDKEKAALSGSSEVQITQTIQTAVSDSSVDLCHSEDE